MLPKASYDIKSRDSWQRHSLRSRDFLSPNRDFLSPTRDFSLANDDDSRISSLRQKRAQSVIAATTESNWIRDRYLNPKVNLEPDKTYNNSKLSESIREFIDKTDLHKREWDNIKAKQRRATSVARDFGLKNDYRATSVARDFGINAKNNRATSVARDSGLSHDYLTPHYANSHRAHSVARSFHPEDEYSSYNDYSYRDTAGPSLSVTKAIYVRPEQNRSQPKKFMSLEDECNWILNGNIGGCKVKTPKKFHNLASRNLSDDEEEDTLDDISGDEVIIKIHEFKSLAILKLLSVSNIYEFGIQVNIEH